MSLLANLKITWMIFFTAINTQMSRIVTKPTDWHVRLAKTQISLGIRPVWSESSLSAWRMLGSLATHWVHSEDSDQTGRMPRLIWVFAGHTFHFVGFVTMRLIMLYRDQMIFHSLTFARSRERCWKPRAKPEIFNNSRGTLRIALGFQHLPRDVANVNEWQHHVWSLLLHKFKEKTQNWENVWALNSSALPQFSDAHCIYKYPRFGPWPGTFSHVDLRA